MQVNSALLLAKNRYGPLYNKKVRIVLITSTVCLTLWSLTLTGQQYDCPGSQPLGHYKIISKVGAQLLADWTDSVTTITIIPYGTIVTVCDEVAYDPINGNKTMKVFYADTTGFVKKESIAAQEKINVAILSRWMSDGFPPAEKYYGIFYRENIYHQNESSIELCETKIDSFLANDSLRYPITYLQHDDKPRILISGIKVKTGTENKGIFFDSKFLYPGESVFWYYEPDTYYTIYAKGEVEENKDTTKIDAFSRIKNYEFHVRRQVNGKIEDKILYNTEFGAWNAFQYEGGINLLWIGDIDGDKKLDMILTVSHHYACWEVVFFLSSEAEPGYFFKEVVKYGDCGC